MSPKTVEAHLTHIYGKLGIRRRTELAHWYRSQEVPSRRPDHRTPGVV